MISVHSFFASSLVITVLSYTTIPFIYGFKQIESFCIAIMAESPLLLNKMVSNKKIKFVTMDDSSNPQ